MKKRSLPLPAPRLELEWKPSKLGWGRRTCYYRLVLPLRQFDIRREGRIGRNVRSELKVKLSHTVVTSSRDAAPILPDGTVETPYRDGAHAQWDSSVLGNLPIYAICGDKFTKIAPEPPKTL